MWRRKTPSNCAGSAASAARERSLRASVLNSTRMQPSGRRRARAAAASPRRWRRPPRPRGRARSSRSPARGARAAGRGSACCRWRGPRRGRRWRRPLEAGVPRRDRLGHECLQPLAVGLGARQPAPHGGVARGVVEVGGVALLERLEHDDLAREAPHEPVPHLGAGRRQLGPGGRAAQPLGRDRQVAHAHARRRANGVARSRPPSAPGWPRPRPGTARRAGRAAPSRSRARRGSAGSGSSSQSTLVTRLPSKLTRSCSVQLADCTRPPSSWLTRPTGSTTWPASAAITARSSRIAAVASSTLTSTTTAA